MSEYVVEMKNIVKSFGEVRAVKEGQFNLKKGEIHSLIGENGAGKSTMMKLLYGMYPINEGEIYIKGEHMTKLDPKIAISHGIGMVHQEFMLVNELTVLENVILGFEPKKGMTIDFDKARKDVQHYIDQYNMEIQLDKKVSQISVGEAQRVEIIKTLMRGAEIIILDEPTAVLTPQETKKLFEILANLKAEGKSLVFISHKLNEVMEISDRISVMRQGTYMGTVNRDETSPLDLTKKMIGREVFLNIEKDYSKAGEKILEVQDVWVPSQKETSKIRGMSLYVRAGEIVGIAGIDGNGQSELIEAITGLRKVEKGAVIATLRNPEFIDLQQAYLEAKAQSAFLEREYERQKTLASQEAASKKRFQQSEADYLSMRSRLEANAAQLAILGVDPKALEREGIHPYLEIKAPLGGYITNMNINVGKYFNAGEPVCDVINKQAPLLRLTAYEKDLNRLQIGDKLEFRVNGISDKAFEATLISIDQMVDENNRSINVYARVEKADQRFRPGMYVNAKIREKP